MGLFGRNCRSRRVNEAAEGHQAVLDLDEICVADAESRIAAVERVDIATESARLDGGDFSVAKLGADLPADR